jgi:hypothetical protein
MRSLSKRKLQDFRLLWVAFEYRKSPASRIGRTNFRRNKEREALTRLPRNFRVAFRSFVGI